MIVGLKTRVASSLIPVPARGRSWSIQGTCLLAKGRETGRSVHVSSVSFHPTLGGGDIMKLRVISRGKKRTESAIERGCCVFIPDFYYAPPPKRK